METFLIYSKIYFSHESFFNTFQQLYALKNDLFQWQSNIFEGFLSSEMTSFVVVNLLPETSKS